jgi:hypothetical protein
MVQVPNKIMIWLCKNAAVKFKCFIVVIYIYIYIFYEIMCRLMLCDFSRYKIAETG